jgi:hypothetical protein
MNIQPGITSPLNSKHPDSRPLNSTDLPTTLSQPVKTAEQRNDVPSSVANTATALFGTQPTSSNAEGLADNQTSLIANYINAPGGISLDVVAGALKVINASALQALMNSEQP